MRIAECKNTLAAKEAYPELRNCKQEIKEFLKKFSEFMLCTLGSYKLNPAKCFTQLLYYNSINYLYVQ